MSSQDADLRMQSRNPMGTGGGTSTDNRPGAPGTGQRSPMQASDVQRMGQEVQEKAGEVIEEAGERTKSMLDSQKGRAAGGLRDIAQVLHRTGEELQKGEQANVAGYAHGAADRLDRWSERLESESVDDLLDGVEGFARRQPEVVIGGAFLLGLLASRFLKSSSARREARRMPVPYTASTESLRGYYVAGNWPKAPSSGMQGGMRPGTSSGTSGPAGQPYSGASSSLPEETP